MLNASKKILWNFLDSLQFNIYRPIIEQLANTSETLEHKVISEFCNSSLKASDDYIRQADLVISCSGGITNIAPHQRNIFIQLLSIPYPTQSLAYLNVFADRVWALSSPLAGRLSEYGVHPGLIKVIHHGINLNLFKQSEPMELPTQKSFKFLFVGSPETEDLFSLVKAFVSSFSQTDDVALVIRANLPPKSRMLIEKECLTTENSPEVVILEDDIPNTEMQKLFSACSCLVHPYQREAFGLQVLEALACELPVVTLDYEGPKDFCTPQNSYLIPYTVQPISIVQILNSGLKLPSLGQLPRIEFTKLSSVLKHVFNGQQEAKEKGVNGRKSVQSLSWQNVGIAIDEEIRSLLDKPAKGEFIQNFLQRSHHTQEEADIALTSFPDSPSLHCHLGVQCYGKGSYDKALEHFKSAWSLFPYSAEYNHWLGLTYIYLQKIDMALEHFFMSIFLEIKNPIYWESLYSMEFQRDPSRVIARLKDKLAEGDKVSTYCASQIHQFEVGSETMTVQDILQMRNIDIFKQHALSLNHPASKLVAELLR